MASVARSVDDISALHRSCDVCGIEMERAFIWPTNKQSGGQVVVELLCGKCNDKRKRAK